MEDSKPGDLGSNTDWTTFVTGLTIFNYVSAKITDFLSWLYHNLGTIYINNTNCLTLLQNLVGYLLKFTEMRYYIQN